MYRSKKNATLSKLLSHYRAAPMHITERTSVTYLVKSKSITNHRQTTMCLYFHIESHTETILKTVGFVQCLVASKCGRTQNAASQFSLTFFCWQCILILQIHVTATMALKNMNRNFLVSTFSFNCFVSRFITCIIQYQAQKIFGKCPPKGTIS